MWGFEARSGGKNLAWAESARTRYAPIKTTSPEGATERVLNMARVRMVILDACRDNAIQQNKRGFLRAFSAGLFFAWIPRPRRLSLG